MAVIINGSGGGGDKFPKPRGGWGDSSEAAAGATIDASPEAWWSEENISDGEVLVRGSGDIVLLFIMPARFGGAVYSVGGGGGGKNIGWRK